MVRIRMPHIVRTAALRYIERHVKTARVLLEHGADATAKEENNTDRLLSNIDCPPPEVRVSFTGRSESLRHAYEK